MTDDRGQRLRALDEAGIRYCHWCLETQAPDGWVAIYTADPLDPAPDYLCSWTCVGWYGLDVAQID